MGKYNNDFMYPKRENLQVAVDGLPLLMLGDELPIRGAGGRVFSSPPSGAAGAAQPLEAPPRRGTRSCVLRSQLLAVVFDTFNDIEKRKFKSLLLHKRTAIQHAYRLLISQRVGRGGGWAGQGTGPCCPSLAPSSPLSMAGPAALETRNFAPGKTRASQVPWDPLLSWVSRGAAPQGRGSLGPAFSCVHAAICPLSAEACRHLVQAV